MWGMSSKQRLYLLANLSKVLLTDFPGRLCIDYRKYGANSAQNARYFVDELMMGEFITLAFGSGMGFAGR